MKNQQNRGNVFLLMLMCAYQQKIQSISSTLWLVAKQRHLCSEWMDGRSFGFKGPFWMVAPDAQADRQEGRVHLV